MARKAAARKPAPPQPVIETEGTEVQSATLPAVATPAGVISLAEIRLVQQYGRIAELKAELRRLESVARPTALEYGANGVRVLEGPDGVVTIAPRAGSRRFDADRAREVLGNLLDAFYSVGDPSFEVNYTPRVTSH